MTENALTPEQLEIVETELVDLFVSLQAEIAAKLGIKPQPDGDWSDEDAQRIFDEVDRRHRPLITARFLD